MQIIQNNSTCTQLTKVTTKQSPKTGTECNMYRYYDAGVAQLSLYVYRTILHVLEIVMTLLIVKLQYFCRVSNPMKTNKPLCQ